ncbi:MAG: SprT family zinc-dependent metalloprotease [Acidobacteriota bacterium]
MQLDLPLTPQGAEQAPSGTLHRTPRTDRTAPGPLLPPPTLRHRARSPVPSAPDALNSGGIPEFIRHPRARRYIIRVRRDGTIRVTIPRGGSKREAEDFARSQAAWVATQRARLADRPPETGRPSLQVDPDALARAKHELPTRLLELAALHGLNVSRVSVRNQRWRWGSCSRNGHICLNWRLVQMPPSVRDYVMIHELMHLKRMDHSPRFWTLVAAACPDYAAARDWLRHHAGEENR